MGFTGPFWLECGGRAGGGVGKEEGEPSVGCWNSSRHGGSRKWKGGGKTDTMMDWIGVRETEVSRCCLWDRALDKGPTLGGSGEITDIMASLPLSLQTKVPSGNWLTRSRALRPGWLEGMRVSREVVSPFPEDATAPLSSTSLRKKKGAAMKLGHATT